MGSAFIKHGQSRTGAPIANKGLPGNTIEFSFHREMHSLILLRIPLFSRFPVSV